MKVLLHTCCGPCASACAPALRSAGHETAAFFSNSNIAPEAEFAKRLDALRTLARADGFEVFADPPRHAEWLEKVARGFEDAPEKGARCERCWRYNLGRAAEFAAENGFDAFTTSLTVSPHKPSARIFEAGEEAAAKAGVRFLREDFKKKDGFKRSLERSRELGLYRQSWCGCEFSHRDRPL